jgi:stress response protein SCP2
MIKNLIVGINWGAIEEDGWFGAKEYINVDLNLKVIIVSDAFELIKVVDYDSSICDYILFDKDDTYGDVGENDFLDNEMVIINISKMPQNQFLLFFVENYTKQEFGMLTHFDYRVYTGEKNEPYTTFYKKDIKELPSFEKEKMIFLGYLKIKENDDENNFFKPLNIFIKSDESEVDVITEVVKLFKKSYLNH